MKVLNNAVEVTHYKNALVVLAALNILTELVLLHVPP